MIGKFLLNAVAAASILAFAAPAQAAPLKGTCTVSASVHGGKKYVTVKCSKASQPGDFLIRSMVWEKDDRARYAKLLRFAGRKYSCNLTNTGTTRGIGMEYTHYDIGDCK